MRENHILFDGYITFGIPEDSRDDKKILGELKNASQTLNRCMESLKIARGDTKVAVYAETEFWAGSFINVKRAFAKFIIVVW